LHKGSWAIIFGTAAYFFYRIAFISVWYFSAAILSLTLYFFLRKLHHEPLLPLPKIKVPFLK